MTYKQILLNAKMKKSVKFVSSVIPTFLTGLTWDLNDILTVLYICAPNSGVIGLGSLKNKALK